MPGAQLVASRYHVGKLLGQGGMGAVYEALDTTNGRRVALKIMRLKLGCDDTEETEREWEVRFDREVRAIGSLKSPHVVQVLDAGVDPDTEERYLVMELLEGEDLSGLSRRLGPLPVDLVIRLGAQTCLGLERAHAAGVVHRDIKPGNLFLTHEHEGEYRAIRILDFGVARVGTNTDGGSDVTELTRTGSMLGSPNYMAPEQARGAKGVDPRADLWSLGVVLYRLLCGKLPHEKGSGGLGDLLIAICCVPAPDLQKLAPWVPAELATIVHRALQIDREQRYPNARTMYEALVALLPDGSPLIHDRQLVPLSPSERAFIAAPAAISVIGTTTGQHPGFAPSAETGTQSSMTSMARSSRRSRVATIAGAAALALGVGGVAVGLAVANVQRIASRSNVALVDASPPDHAAEPPPAPAPTPITASVAIPKGAKVAVDGVPVDAPNHRLELHGVAGDVRKVKIVVAGVERVEDVAITPSGPVPASIMLPSDGPRALHGTQPVAKTGGGKAAGQQVPAAPTVSARPPGSGLRTDFE